MSKICDQYIEQKKCGTLTHIRRPQKLQSQHLDGSPSADVDLKMLVKTLVLITDYNSGDFCLQKHHIECLVSLGLSVMQLKQVNTVKEATTADEVSLCINESHVKRMLLQK